MFSYMFFTYSTAKSTLNENTLNITKLSYFKVVIFNTYRYENAPRYWCFTTNCLGTTTFKIKADLKLNKEASQQWKENINNS